MWWQGDKRWGAWFVGWSADKNDTMANVGCLTVAVAAALRKLLDDNECTPLTVLQAAKAWPGDVYADRKNPAAAVVTELAKSAGLVASDRVEGADLAAFISASLARPKTLVLLHVSHKPGVTKGQHWLLADAAVDATVHAADPAQPNRVQRFSLADLTALEVSPFKKGPYVIRGARSITVP